MLEDTIVPVTEVFLIFDEVVFIFDEVVVIIDEVVGAAVSPVKKTNLTNFEVAFG